MQASLTVLQVYNLLDEILDGLVMVYAVSTPNMHDSMRWSLQQPAAILHRLCRSRLRWILRICLNGRPSPDRKLGITLSAFVSILSRFARPGLLLPIAEGA